jgi:hypothetical protein
MTEILKTNVISILQQEIKEKLKEYSEKKSLTDPEYFVLAIGI